MRKVQRVPNRAPMSHPSPVITSAPCQCHGSTRTPRSAWVAGWTSARPAATERAAAPACAGDDSSPTRPRIPSQASARSCRAVRCQAGVRLQRDPGVRHPPRVVEPEPLRRHPHDHVGPPVHSEHTAHHGRVAAERARPEAVCHHYRDRVGRRPVLLSEEAAQRRREPQHREVATRHVGHLDRSPTSASAGRREPSGTAHPASSADSTPNSRSTKSGYDHAPPRRPASVGSTSTRPVSSSSNGASMVTRKSMITAAVTPSPVARETRQTRV